MHGSSSQTQFKSKLAESINRALVNPKFGLFNAVDSYTDVFKYDLDATSYPFEIMPDGEPPAHELVREVSRCAHRDTISRIAVNPFFADRVATASYDRTVKVWKFDHEAGTRTLAFEHAVHTEAVRDVAWHSDGTIYASVGHDQMLHVYKDQEKLSSIRLPNVGYSCDISASGSHILVGTVYAICKYDLETSTMIRSIPAHKLNVHSVRYHPASMPLVVSCGDDGRVRLWDIDEGRCVQTIGDHTAAPTLASFSPDGCMLGTAGLDGLAHLYTLGQRKPLYRFLRSSVPVTDVAVSDAAVCVSGEDGDIVTYSLDTGHRLRTLHGHLGAVRTLAIQPASGIVYSGGTDGTLRVWDLLRPPPIVAQPPGTISKRTPRPRPDSVVGSILSLGDLDSVTESEGSETSSARNLWHVPSIVIDERGSSDSMSVETDDYGDEYSSYSASTTSYSASQSVEVRVASTNPASIAVRRQRLFGSSGGAAAAAAAAAGVGPMASGSGDSLTESAAGMGLESSDKSRNTTASSQQLRAHRTRLRRKLHSDGSDPSASIESEPEPRLDTSPFRGVRVRVYIQSIVGTGTRIVRTEPGCIRVDGLDDAYVAIAVCDQVVRTSSANVVRDGLWSSIFDFEEVHVAGDALALRDLVLHLMLFKDARPDVKPYDVASVSLWLVLGDSRLSTLQLALERVSLSITLAVELVPASMGDAAASPLLHSLWRSTGSELRETYND